MNRALFQPPGVSSNDNRRVLVVSDSGESRQRIRAALTKNDVEIIFASSPKEMCRGCFGWNDLVVVDIDPKHLTEILGALRRCAGCTKIPVLVEASRISAEPSLAGLLPTYRAMPCNATDLLTLSRHIIGPEEQEQRQRGIL